MNRIIVILATLPILGGCGGNREPDAASGLAQWIGASDRELVLAWGAPDASYELADGSRVLSWRNVRTETVPGELHTTEEAQVIYGQTVAVPVIRQGASRSIRLECTTNMEIGRDGIVREYAMSGNACPEDIRD